MFLSPLQNQQVYMQGFKNGSAASNLEQFSLHLGPPLSRLWFKRFDHLSNWKNSPRPKIKILAQLLCPIYVVCSSKKIAKSTRRTISPRYRRKANFILPPCLILRPLTENCSHLIRPTKLKSATTFFFKKKRPSVPKIRNDENKDTCFPTYLYWTRRWKKNLYCSNATALFFYTYDKHPSRFSRPWSIPWGKSRAPPRRSPGSAPRRCRGTPSASSSRGTRGSAGSPAWTRPA